MPLARRRRTSLTVASVIAVPLVIALAAALPALDAVRDAFDAPLPERDPAPPSVVVATRQGAGVLAPIVVAGSAVGEGDVLDVLVSLDDGPWSSVATVTRGATGATWTHTFAAADPGDHVAAFRAFDGAAYGLPVTWSFRAGAEVAPPTVAILTPTSGSGHDATEALTITGTVDGARVITDVWVSLNGGANERADLVGRGVAATAWSFTYAAGAVPPGVHTVSVSANDGLSDGDSLSQAQHVTVATDARGPAPSVSIASPRDGTGVSARHGSGSCVAVAPCVRLTGALQDPATLAYTVEISVDDGPWTDVAATPGGLVTRTGGAASWTFEWPVADAYAGLHTFRARAATLDGALGVPAVTRVAVASERALTLIATPGGASLTGTRVAATAVWPDGTPATNASWTLDGDAAPVDGVGVLVTRFATPGDHVATALARDAHGRSARAALTLTALNRAPHAAFADPGAVATNTTVELNASTSTDADGAIAAVQWTIGEAAPGPWSPRLTYRTAFADPGLVNVTLRVRDGYGAQSAPVTRVVAVADAKPLAAFSVTPERDLGVAATLRFVDASFDADGPLVARSWDFGDGTQASCDAFACTRLKDGQAVGPWGDGAVFEHRYARAATYRVALIVWDASGQAATAERFITIEDRPPVAAFTWTPLNPRTGDRVSFTDASSDADGAVTRWQWLFGDGVDCAALPPLERTNASCATVSHEREPAYHFPARGVHNVTLAVHDALGQTASVTRGVHVGNAPPIVNFTLTPHAPRAFEPVTLQAVAADPDGNLSRYLWRIGASRTANTSVVTHAFPHQGAFNVSLTVWDVDGLSATEARVVNVTNLPPIVTVHEAPTTAYAGIPVTFTASADDRDGRLVAMAWRITGPFVNASFDGGNVQYLFENPGVYQATFTARDDDGGVTTVVRDIEVGPAPTGNYPPRISVTFPTPDAAFKGAVRFAGTASSVAPLSRVEISIWKDGRVMSPFSSTWVRTTGLEDWFFDFEARTLPNGPYELAARVTDARGARAEERVPFTIVNTDFGATDLISLQVLNLTKGDVLNGTRTVTGTAFHPDGITYLRVRVDDGAWANGRRDGATWSFVLDSLVLGNGDHTFAVRAYHGAVAYQERVVPFVIKNRAPELVVTHPLPVNVTGVVDVAGGFSKAGPPGRVLWRVDHGVWHEAEGTPEWRVRLDSRHFENGNHTLHLKPVNPDGLAGHVVRFAFRTDNLAPLEDRVTPVTPAAKAAQNGVPGATFLLTVAVAAAAAVALRPRRGAA